MKIKFFLFITILSLLYLQPGCKAEEIDGCPNDNCLFNTAFTAGYVFKPSDHIFKEVYGRGMGNVITGDFCYYPWRCWGIGAKVSYWLAPGKTTFFKRKTFLQEVPITAYLRGLIDFKSCLQLYASLGGGAAWIRESSYLGHVSQWRGLGEFEVGLLYPAWRCVDFTAAARYLFPRQSQQCNKLNAGGFDLRAGIGLAF